MKKFVSILVLAVLLIGASALIDYLPDTNEISVQSIVAPFSDKEAFDALREKVEAAGYIVTDSFVDSKFEGVKEAFSVKINFDANTVATIPVVLCENEAAVDYNCEILEGGIKLPIRNGCIFSFPGKDYPEDVLAVVKAIVYDKEISENPFKK